MYSSYLRDLMRVYFRDGEGKFAMLECYADDSGTHDSSNVVVWGGVLGDQHYLEEFEKAWNARLQAPCDGKPPLRKGFHSVQLAHGTGEFEGYNQGERDLTRRNFRQAIVESSLSWISYAISKDDYAECAKRYFRVIAGTAEQLVFGCMVVAICDAVQKGGEHVSFQFDRGRESYVAPMVQLAIEQSDINDKLVSHGFSSVQKNVGLQAADLVAHETYCHFKKYINDQSVEADAHLKRLVEDPYDGRSYWFGRKEIEDMFSSMDKSIEKTLRKMEERASSEQKNEKSS